MSNYEQVDPETIELISNVIENKFPALMGCNITPIYRVKKSKSKGKYTIAKLDKPGAITKHIFQTVNGNDLDYILLLDLSVFNALSDSDKKLTIEHTLNFAEVDMDKESPYNLRGAEVETFYDIIELTKDDPRWQQRLQDIAASIHEEEKDD